MNAMLEQINSMGRVFVEFAGPMLVQSSALIVILLLVDFLLRKRVRAVFRYFIWMLVLVKLILPSSLSTPVSVGYWFGDELANVKVSDLAVAVNPANMSRVTGPEPTGVGSEAPAATLREAVEPAVSETVSSGAVSATTVTWQGVVFLVWLAVVVVMALLLLQRAIFVSGLVAQAGDADSSMNDAFEYCCGRIGIRGKVGLKVSANATSPAVCGLFRPVVLVPQNLGPRLEAGGLRAVLLHELAHIKRGDLWVNLAQTLLQIVYFYNPLLWLANAVIRRVREQAVDEMVQVAMGEKAQQYPQTLVNVAKLAFKRPALSLRLIGVVESKSALKGRIKRMLNRPIPKSAKLGVAGLLAVVIAGAVLLPMAKAEKRTDTEDTKGVFPEALNEAQRLYMEWTEEFFSNYLDRSKYADMPESAKMELEQEWIKILEGPWSKKYYDAINCLAVIKSKKAVRPLLKIATERREKDNRDRWMATRALGIVGDESIVPELIHLVYHYNQNTRFWAQISLVRLTGVNYGSDWVKWWRWWNTKQGKLSFSEEKIKWTSRSEWADPRKQQESDRRFIEGLKRRKSGETPAKDSAPVVVGTTPAAFADDVSLSLNKITVTFDQPMMDRSWSWTGGGDTYPETTGRPRYDSSRTTCTLPVKLEPGKGYWVGINSPSYKNFKNPDRVPAKRYVILFATKGTDGRATPIPSDMLAKARRINAHAESGLKKVKSQMMAVEAGGAGSDSGSDTKALQRLIDSARVGGTVTIPKGVYTEPIAINKSLKLKGESRVDCVFEVTADRPAIFVDTKGKGRVTIEDVTIKWQLAISDRCENPFAVAVKDSRAEIKNCCFYPLGNFKRSPVAVRAVGFSNLTISSCRFEGFEYVVCYGEGTKGTIQDSLIMDCGHQGISLYEGAKVDVHGNLVTGSRYHAVRSTGGTLDMKDNLIIENANRGVYLGNKSARGTITNNVIIGNKLVGVSGFAQSDVKIHNNLILNSGQVGIGAQPTCRLLVKDNIIMGNPRGIVVFLKEGHKRGKLFIRRNTFWDNDTDTENCEKASESISEEPAFHDPANGDFSLKPGLAKQHNQGLTNPEVFKALWKRWQNRADKSEPFSDAGKPTVQVEVEDVK